MNRILTLRPLLLTNPILSSYVTTLYYTREA